MGKTGPQDLRDPKVRVPKFVWLVDVNRLIRHPYRTCPEMLSLLKSQTEQLKWTSKRDESMLNSSRKEDDGALSTRPLSDYCLTSISRVLRSIWVALFGTPLACVTNLYQLIMGGSASPFFFYTLIIRFYSEVPTNQTNDMVFTRNYQLVKLGVPILREIELID